jgi:hypothetical protein
MTDSQPNLRVVINGHVSGGDGKIRYLLHLSTDCCDWDFMKRYEIYDLKMALAPKYISVKSS